MSDKIRRTVTDNNLANDEKLNKLADRVYDICKKSKISLNDFGVVIRKVKRTVKNNAMVQ